LFRYLPRIALLFGNIVIGLLVVAPAGMLADLAHGLDVDIQAAGLLVTYGAVALCVSSPLSVWVTARVDRRLLLAGTLGFIAIGEAATALAPNYETVLVLRLLMLVVGAVYTPQAAATVGMLVPEKERAGAISFVFLGWSLAMAAGLPLVTLLTAHVGWRATFGLLAALSALICLMLVVSLPGGLRGNALALRSFVTVVRRVTLAVTLLITMFIMSGQFVIAVYLVPLIEKLTGYGHAMAGALFALLGCMGLVGNAIASSIVARLGVQVTLAIFLCSVALGLVLWAAGAGYLFVMTAGVAFWGLGFAAANSMQQARLAAAAPDLASAAISLNSSILYVGQALGSAIGGFLFVHDALFAIGYAAAGFGLLSLVLLALIWERPPTDAALVGARLPASR
jgi:predicted MFS family arabinose efflux permease